MWSLKQAFQIVPWNLLPANALLRKPELYGADGSQAYTNELLHFVPTAAFGKVKYIAGIDALGRAVAAISGHKEFHIYWFI